MSFLKKLFGGDFEGSVKKADGLAEAGRLGEAVLELSEALGRTKGVEPERIEAARERLATIKDELSRSHVEEGRRLLSEGELERALDLFETAAEAASSEEVAEEARALIDNLEAEDARLALSLIHI